MKDRVGKVVQEAMGITHYRKRFMEYDILEALKGRSSTLKEIAGRLGCSDRTAWNLVKMLMSRELVGRKNRGSDKKPLWEYYVMVSKPSLRSMGVENETGKEVTQIRQARKTKISDLGLQL